jgi:hypothetical protein
VVSAGGLSAVNGVRFVRPLKRDIAYDARAGQAAMAVEVHYADGSTAESLLLLEPGQVELYEIQLGQAIEARRVALGSRL